MLIDKLCDPDFDFNQLIFRTNNYQELRNDLQELKYKEFNRVTRTEGNRVSVLLDRLIEHLDKTHGTVYEPTDSIFRLDNNHVLI